MYSVYEGAKSPTSSKTSRGSVTGASDLGIRSRTVRGISLPVETCFSTIPPSAVLTAA